jgi:orotidine-5'-phosphate decarboxylase
MRTMVPGIRMPGQAADDQARVAAPGEAIATGADWLVIGRAVTKAAEPEVAAAAIAADVESALRT